MPLLVILQAQQRGRMDRDEDAQSIRRVQDLASVALDGDRPFRESLGCGRPQGDNKPRMNEFDFFG